MTPKPRKVAWHRAHELDLLPPIPPGPPHACTAYHGPAGSGPEAEALVRRLREMYPTTTEGEHDHAELKDRMDTPHV